jgi:hypothetical protein
MMESPDAGRPPDEGALDRAERDAAREAAEATGPAGQAEGRGVIESSAPPAAGREIRSGPDVKPVEPAVKEQAKARTGGAKVGRAAKPSAPPTSASAAAASANGGRPSEQHVVVQQGRLDEAAVQTIDVHQGGIGRATARDVSVSQGGIGMARAERVTVELGGIGLAAGGDVSITQGGANTVFARDARIDRAFVQTVVAGSVRAERPVGVLFLLARRVEGDIRPVFDWRGALALGLVAGLLRAIFRRRG